MNALFELLDINCKNQLPGNAITKPNKYKGLFVWYNVVYDFIYAISVGLQLPCQLNNPT